MSVKIINRWFIILVGFVLVSALGFWAYGGPTYLSALSEARNAYETSRHGTPDSLEFITRNLAYGMKPEDVQKKMDGAAQVLLGMPQSMPPWRGRVDLFIFRYGSPWKGPLCSNKKYLYEEWYWVYYNEGKIAVKIKRDMVKGTGSDVEVKLSPIGLATADKNNTE